LCALLPVSRGWFASEVDQLRAPNVVFVECDDLACEFQPPAAGTCLSDLDDTNSRMSDSRALIPLALSALRNAVELGAASSSHSCESVSAVVIECASLIYRQSFCGVVVGGSCVLPVWSADIVPLHASLCFTTLAAAMSIASSPSAHGSTLAFALGRSTSAGSSGSLRGLPLFLAVGKVAMVPFLLEQ